MYQAEAHLQKLLLRMEGKIESDGSKIDQPKEEEKNKKTHRYDDYKANSSPIPLYILASELFPHLKDRIIAHANTAAELLWRKGLNLEGASITGNGYLMLNMYRMYARLCNTEKEEQANVDLFMLAGEWRTKAFMFAQALFDPKKAGKNSESDTNARNKTWGTTQGIPDHPFSLIENNELAGKICFLSDLFRDSDESCW